jgi:hypothetical protein
MNFKTWADTPIRPYKNMFAVGADRGIRSLIATTQFFLQSP